MPRDTINPPSRSDLDVRTFHQLFKLELHIQPRRGEKGLEMN
jgi:hypothetical protein